MDFVMNHGGLFISIGVITLLALIGYYADKKESKSKNNVASTSKPTASSSSDVSQNSNGHSIFGNSDLNNDVDDKTFSFDSTFYSPVQDFESLDNTDSISSNDSSINNFESLGSNISDVPSVAGSIDNFQPESYNLNSFENVEMSLEDLEKKNYEKIASTSESADSDDYCYDDLDDAPVSIVSVPDSDLPSDSVKKQSIELDSNNTDLVDQQFLDLNFDNSNIVEEQSIDLNPTSSDNSIGSADNNVVESDSVQKDDYRFDDEVQSDVPEVFDMNTEKDLSESVIEPDGSASIDSQVIPEINDSGVVSDFYDLDNSTDDIWKF